MTPIIVSAKTAAIILAGVTACFNHLKAPPGAGFQPGWESCTKLIAFESNMETQDQADATARADAADKAALAAANRIVEAGGKTP